MKIHDIGFSLQTAILLINIIDSGSESGVTVSLQIFFVNSSNSRHSEVLLNRKNPAYFFYLIIFFKLAGLLR